jgi:hypothetical protein
MLLLKCSRYVVADSILMSHNNIILIEDVCYKLELRILKGESQALSHTQKKNPTAYF